MQMEVIPSGNSVFLNFTKRVSIPRVNGYQYQMGE